MSTLAPLEVGDWTTLTLAPGGRALIEASAGTGKTWTIAALYLRLLLERELGPRQIVVTTFTDAAAQELRERLRGKLVWAEAQAEQALDGLEPAAPAPDQGWLWARWREDRNQAGRDRLRLKLAQAELDLAPVGTLHGLCRRILTDYPFESSAGFELGELVAADALLDEWSQDLWRQLQQGDTSPPVAAPESLAELRTRLKAYLQPGVALWAPDEAELARRLPPAQADALDALAERKDLFAPRKSALKNALKALAAWIRDGEPLKESSVANLLGDWSEQCLAEAWARLRDDPLRRFAVAAARLSEYHAALPRVRAWQGWLAQVRRWREQRLSARGQLSFDELIARVGEALARPGQTLAARLHAEWPVALVDEFQDTDAQQYAILDAIYRDEERQPRGRLVMIGDPKQAIYRFRGGDIDAYLGAAASADEVLRLAVNHRSASRLVGALNQLYALGGEALSQDPSSPIRYQPVSASGRRDDEPYLIDGGPVQQPLHLHLWPDPPLAVGAQVRLALEACANQIAGMLQSGAHRIGDAPLRPGDIAVLLPGNADIAQLRGLLQRRGVPCVGAGRSTVFASDSARELQIVLYGIEHANQEAPLRAALATRLYGLGYAELLALRAQPEAWLVHEQRVQAWQRRWRQDGVLAVVRAVIEHAGPGLLAGEEGERRLTDLRHLGELLQEASDQLHGAEQLLDWFGRQRDGESAGEAADEQQLRIESDARRVRLMTLHASKGLEFPLVFLPLMWDHGRNAQDSIPVILEPACGQRVIGFGKAARAQYDAEGQDERYRVLYVALTRAIHAAHVYLLPPQRPADARPNSKPARDPQRAPLDGMLERLQQRVAAGANWATDAPAVDWSEQGWPWPWQRYEAVEAVASERRVLAPPSIRAVAQVYSFSTLIRSVHANALEDQPASDEQALEPSSATLDWSEPARPAHPELAELAAIRGADIGNALHAIFENRELGLPMAAQGELIDASLREYGVAVDADERATVITRLARRVQANLDTELLPGLLLGQLPAHRQLVEMEFHYVLDTASMLALREACARHGEPELVPLTAVTSLRGRMTGKIDLILEHEGRYIVLDYKSNYLGDSLDDYRPAALRVAMDDHHYRFQALLYTVALDRMLRQRIVDYRRATQLGESIYLFVRAVGLEPDAGVWRHRFDDALIEAADMALAGAGQDRP